MRRLALMLLVASSAALPAQRADSLRAGVVRRVPAATAPLMSLIVPGSGQFRQGKERSVIYLTVEALYWWKLSKDVSERRRSSDAYKDLARRVARANYRPRSGDGDWTYYESMRDYLESGNFSMVENGLQPETDTTTFNGRLWQLIRRTTPGCTDTNAACSAGITRYTQAAIPADLQWSWTNAQLQWDLFKRTTELRNDANHAVQQDVSILVFNHLLSMVDAFAVLRLESHVDSHGRPSVGANIKW